MSTIDLVLANEHSLIALAIQKVLEKEPTIKVTGIAKDGEELLELVLKLKPDVIFSPLFIPGKTIFTICKEIDRLQLPTKVIIQLDISEVKWVLQADEYHVSGYLSKSVKPEELIKAIIDVHNGLNYYCQNISIAIMAIFRNKQNKRNDRLINIFSKREIETLGLISQGFGSVEIATKLNLSVSTINNRRHIIIKKAGVSSTTDLIKWYVENFD
jgi:DNA-binding NarL/FixJ family response regulator